MGWNGAATWLQLEPFQCSMNAMSGDDAGPLYSRPSPTAQASFGPSTFTPLRLIASIRLPGTGAVRGAVGRLDQAVPIQRSATAWPRGPVVVLIGKLIEMPTAQTSPTASEPTLISWVEEHFAISVEDDDLSPDKFSSVDAICAYVDGALSATTAS